MSPLRLSKRDLQVHGRALQHCVRRLNKHRRGFLLGPMPDSSLERAHRRLGPHGSRCL